jgi:hypothetical protein
MDRDNFTLTLYCCLCPFWFSLCSLNRTVLPQPWRSAGKKKTKIFHGKTHENITYVLHKCRCLSSWNKVLRGDKNWHVLIYTISIMQRMSLSTWVKSVRSEKTSLATNAQKASWIHSIHRLLTAAVRLLFAYLLSSGLFSGSVGSSDNIALNNNMITK